MPTATNIAKPPENFARSPDSVPVIRTDRQLRGLKPSPTGRPYRRRISDSKGLYIEVSSAGSKLWRMRYYFAGREKLLSLGKYPAVPLASARAAHALLVKALAEGVDPSEKRKTERAIRAEEQRANKIQQLTFRAMAEEWFQAMTASFSPRYRPKIRARLDRYLLPALGGRPLAEIRPEEALEALETIAGEEGSKAETAKRVRQIGAAVYKRAILKGKAHKNPFEGLNAALPKSRPSHFAAPTSPADLALVLRAFGGFNGAPIVQAMLRLTPMLLVRPGELRHMKWSDVNWAESQWEFPLSKSKANKAHIVPLPTQALRLLRGLQPLTGGSEWVFPLLIDFRRPAHENTVLNAIRKLGVSKQQATAHGFRATARTILDEVLHERVEHIEHQLGHRVRDSLGNAYNRTTHLPERRVMMQRWADYLDTLQASADTAPLKRTEYGRF